MKKLKLPVIKDEETYWPSEPTCPICKKRKVLEPHSMAVLGVGALLMDRKNDSGGPSSDMDAFFHLTWHGAHDGGEGEDRKDNRVNSLFSIFFEARRKVRLPTRKQDRP
jgi:hypothetical protein